MNANSLNLARIEHKTLNEIAYDRMKRALLSGRIEPGTTLTLRQLAEELGTSMMPVREAITRLSAENAVQVLPKRGIFVPALSAADACDLWDLRIRLEGDACARAAQRITQNTLAWIRGLCNQVQAEAERGELHAVLERNSDFQFAVYEAAQSPTLLQLIEILRMRSVPHCTAAMRALLDEHPPYYQQTWENHSALVDALERGDGTEARRVKQRDLREFRDFVEARGSLRI